MKTAMILAAGRGERLKPLTNYIPKAMCRVKNIPLIEYHIIGLVKAGFERVVINHAHLGHQIRRYFGNGKAWGVEICYSPEPPGGLETGGGIVKALPLLGKEPFLTVNADIVTDFSFSAFALPQKSLVHLALGKNPTHNQKGDFGLNEQSQLLNIEKKYTYLGIASYHPDVFQYLQPGRYSVTPIIRNLTDQHLASGEVYSGLWVDIGTEERLAYAEQNLK